MEADERASEQELFNDGFYTWDFPLRENSYITCVSCTENPKQNAEKIPVNVTPSNKVIITSGFRLGNPQTNRQNILSVINKSCKTLIVNGDIIDCSHYKDLTPSDYTIIEALEYYQKQGKAILLKGQSEYWITDIEKLFPLTFVDDYKFKYLTEHNFYVIPGHKLHGYMGMKLNALRFAEENNIDAIFIGSTYNAETYKQNNNSCLYVNTGGFFNFTYKWVELDGITNNVILKGEDTKCSESQESRPIIPIIPSIPIYDLPRMTNLKQKLEVA